MFQVIVHFFVQHRYICILFRRVIQIPCECVWLVCPMNANQLPNQCENCVFFHEQKPVSRFLGLIKKINLLSSRAFRDLGDVTKLVVK